MMVGDYMFTFTTGDADLFPPIPVPDLCLRRRPRAFPTAEPRVAREGQAAQGAEKAEDRQEK